VDPITLAVVGIALGVSLAVGAAVFYWTKILEWGYDSVLPWIRKHLPGLEKYVRDAFVYLDKLAAPAQAVTKEAWRHLRQVLLRQVQVFEKHADGTWRIRIISWLRAALEELGAPEPSVVEVTTERTLNWVELPGEVREQCLRYDITRPIDVTEARDKELGLEMSI
jgi:hypothetical protein